MGDKMFKEALQIYMDREFERLTKEIESSPKYKFSLEFEQKVKSLIRETNRKYITVGRYTIRRIALIAIIAALFLTGSVGIKPVREAIIQYWIDLTDKNTTISIERNQEAWKMDFEVSEIDIPSEFELVSKEIREEVGLYRSEYIGKNGERIYYKQIGAENIVANLDTENAIVYEIEIKGRHFKCIEEKSMNYVVWVDEYYYYQLCGTCEIEVLVEMIKEVI